MAFIFKRKRFKFLVTLDVQELSLTPLVNGILFAKVRLISGGSFEECTTREEISHHRVQWNKKCQFECRIYATNSTGELETCICRVSVRKEAKGGKAYQKLGFVDINLSEYAGAHSSRRYLLEGYTSKSRLDNSLLQVNVAMKLLSGDPVFKVPKAKTVELPGQVSHDVDLHPENKGAVSGSEDSVASESSGFGSLTRQKREQNAAESRAISTDGKTSDGKGTPSVSTNEEKAACEGDGHHTLTPSSSSQGQLTGHNRNSSSTSAMSKVSGYHSLGGIAIGHSRQGSSDSTSTPHTAHKRSRSVDVAETNRICALPMRKDKISEPSGSIEQRLGSTRIDADEIIENLLQGTDFQEAQTNEEGLALYVGPDGSTAFSSQQLRSGKYERVVMDSR